LGIITSLYHISSSSSSIYLRMYIHLTQLLYIYIVYLYIYIYIYIYPAVGPYRLMIYNIHSHIIGTVKLSQM
ncbi:hypothetical protein ACMBCM_10050, partial [Spiroplasma sp. K1]